MCIRDSALWVARKGTPYELIEALGHALTFGVEHTYEAVLEYGFDRKPYDAYAYLTRNIDYLYDNQKQKALRKFWDAEMCIRDRTGGAESNGVVATRRAGDCGQKAAGRETGAGKRRTESAEKAPAAGTDGRKTNGPGSVGETGGRAAGRNRRSGNRRRGEGGGAGKKGQETP